MYFKYEEKNYSVERYPSSDNKSLRAWSAADEYLLKYLKELFKRQELKKMQEEIKL